MNKELQENLFTLFSPTASATGICYIEIINKNEGLSTSAGSKLYSASFPRMNYSELSQAGLIPPAIGDSGSSFPAEGRNTVYCHLRQVSLSGDETLLLLMETDKPMDAVVTALGSFFLELVKQCQDSKPNASDGINEKYKDQLIKMRSSQAALFPRFEEIASMDISAVYLPADLMTGTFIDAFFIDDHIYQIITCEIMGSDPSTSITGASVRALARTLSTKQMIPSALIDKLIGRLHKILPGIGSSLQLSVYKLNTKTGNVIFSSYGDISTMFFSKKRKGIVDLAQTAIGKELTKKIVFKDMHLNLETGDALFYYTKTASGMLDETKKQVFGEQRLKKIFIEQSDNMSRDIVHDITDELYTFSNYSPIEKDIILLSIKMK